MNEVSEALLNIDLEDPQQLQQAKDAVSLLRPGFANATDAHKVRMLYIFQKVAEREIVAQRQRLHEQEITDEAEDAFFNQVTERFRTELLPVLDQKVGLDEVRALPHVPANPYKLPSRSKVRGYRGVAAVAKAFKVSANWLATGEGEIFLTQEEKAQIDRSPEALLTRLELLPELLGRSFHKIAGETNYTSYIFYEMKQSKVISLRMALTLYKIYDIAPNWLFFGVGSEFLTQERIG